MLRHLPYLPIPGLHFLLAGGRVGRQEGLHCTGHLGEAEGQRWDPVPSPTHPSVFSFPGACPPPRCSDPACPRIFSRVGRCLYPISDNVGQSPQPIPGYFQVIRQNDDLYILVVFKLLLVEVKPAFDTW